jgi:hypothetical protein
VVPVNRQEIDDLVDRLAEITEKMAMAALTAAEAGEMMAALVADLRDDYDRQLEAEQ